MSASTAAVEATVEPADRSADGAGGRSVKYPAGWLGADNLGILYVVTSQDANDRLLGTGRLNAGDVFIQFSENSILAGMTGDPAVHLPDNLKFLASPRPSTSSPRSARRAAPGSRIPTAMSSACGRGRYQPQSRVAGRRSRATGSQPTGRSPARRSRRPPGGRPAGTPPCACRPSPTGPSPAPRGTLRP